jgi:hypothetical protein
MTTEERLEKLEGELGRQKRRNRLLLWSVLGLAGILIIPLFFETTAFRARAQSAGVAKEIHAKSFILEDENGNMRAELTMGVSGSGLTLYNENGLPLIILAANKGLPSLSLSDEKLRLRALLVAGNQGGNLQLLDENQHSRILLGVLKRGPSLLLYDEKGNERFKAGMAETVSPEGKTITYPESSLILFGPDGRVIWSAIK